MAAQQGLPTEEIERMLAAFWGQDSAVSPVERRVGVLRRFWEAFDDAHSRQAPGMTPLWGLVEERHSLLPNTESPQPYTASLYRRLLPDDLVAEVDELWGRLVLPRWPERLVTEPYPHAAMAEAFGPALAFWHGCALTAWFVCEGPASRTDMAGLREYHRKEVAALADLGTPVDPALFDELAAAERRLGPEQAIEDPDRTSTIAEGGFEITISMSVGTRRGGFERLRDIVTRHRRAWAGRHLDAYLRARWEGEVRAAARAYHTALNDRGRPPTARESCRVSVTPLRSAR